MSHPPENYRWWREHGKTWRDVVSERKGQMPIYHLQEIFLDEYFASIGRAKVLEFGCGFGRHLEYLRKNRRLDLHGFDQSESMVAGMEWARSDWRERRITVGEPLARLPYEDGAFDVVYTVSVLIHVRPEDLESVLSELWRVSSGHLLHIENPAVDQTVETSPAHDGCWGHNMSAAYDRVAPGAKLECSPSLFQLEDVYRIAKADKKLPALMRPERAERFRALDDAMTAEVNRLGQSALVSARQKEALLEKTNGIRGRLDAANERLRAQSERVEALDSVLDALRVRSRDAEEAQETLRERAKHAELSADELRARARKSEALVLEVRDRAIKAEARLAESFEALSGARTDLVEARKTLSDLRTERDELATQLADERVARDAQSTEFEVMKTRLKDADRLVLDLRDRENSAIGRADRLDEQIEIEGLERDRLNVDLMNSHHALDRLRDRERDAQSRVIALRRRAELAEARIVQVRNGADLAQEKAEGFRLRARRAESEIVRLERESASERERADRSLGKIDEAVGARVEAENEIKSLRAQLAQLLKWI